MTKSNVFLAITSAVAIAGKIATRGDIVQVDEDLAVNLLQRGKAELATADDAPDAPLSEPEGEDDADADADADDKAPAKPAAAKPEKPAK